MLQDQQFLELSFEIVNGIVSLGLDKHPSEEFSDFNFLVLLENRVEVFAYSRVTKLINKVIITKLLHDINASIKVDHAAAIELRELGLFQDRGDVLVADLSNFDFNLITCSVFVLDCLG
jgi:hypothetical protein